MTYKSYDNSKHKLRTEWLNTYKNKNKLETYKPITIDFKSRNYFKKSFIIPFDYNEDGNPITKEIIYINEGRYWLNKLYIVNLKNLEEWVIPFININVILDTTEGFLNKLLNHSDIRWGFDYNYIFKKDLNSKADYKLLVYLYIQFNNGINELYPLFFNLLITIINPKNYYAIQRIKSQT